MKNIIELSELDIKVAITSYLKSLGHNVEKVDIKVQKGYSGRDEMARDTVSAVANVGEKKELRRQSSSQFADMSAEDFYNK